MITVKKEVSLPVTYPLERIGELSSLLFFDIETTGFSGDYAKVYLIGCTFHSGSSWTLIQWFSERSDDEEEVLQAFFHFLKGFRFLIHFNGDGFDIPFLLKRCAAFGLSCNFDDIISVDIYRMIKPYKKLLGLESMKQKSLEQFLGISREDKYSGGQLIEVYQDFLTSRDDLLYRLLILHNEDDLKGMPSILPILNYHDFLTGSFTFTGQRLRSITDYQGKQEKYLLLTYQSQITLPVPLETSSGPFELSLEKDRLTLTVPLVEGELKHFYEDYQNYFYLIYEDTAIHKSVGQYVERKARRRATAKTCYTRVSGLFLPQPEIIWNTYLKREWKDKLTYVPYEEALFSDGETARRYLKAALSLH